MSFWLRKQILVFLATILVAFSNVIYALGLGEAKVLTELYQPLRAEIALTDVAGLNASNIKVGLASHDDFKRVGIDYQYALTELKFRVVFDKNGKRYIEITTDNPVRESYLHFLIEINAPGKSGKTRQSFLREYTLLLDAPLYKTDIETSAIPNPIPSASSSSAVKDVLSTPSSSSSRSAKTHKSSAPISGDQYYTISGDTLWEIVLRMGAGKNAHQAMLAIVDLNPNAFIGGNVNLVKAGFVLRLPDQTKINQIGRETALTTVQDHNKVWRSGSVNSKSLDATVRTKAGNAPRATDKDNLRLIADGSSSASQEQLRSTLDENNELKSRLNSLQSQVDQLNRLVELKNQELAGLQQSLSNQEKNNKAEETIPIVRPDQLQTTQEASTPLENITPEPSRPPVVTPSPPVDPEPVKPEDVGLVDQVFNIANDLLNDTTIMTAAGGLFLLLILIFAISKVVPMLRSGRRMRKDDDDELDFAELEMLQQAKSSVLSSGAISEADSFIGYGQYNEALDALTKAIDEAPANTALRLKLLEVLAELDNVHEFSTQEKQLLAIGGDEIAEQIYVIKQAYPNLSLENKASVATEDAKEDDEIVFAGLNDFVNDVSLDTLDEFSEFTQTILADNEQAAANNIDLELDFKDGELDFDQNTFEIDEIPAEQVKQDFSNDFNFEDNTTLADENVDLGLNFDDIELEKTEEEQIDDQIEAEIADSDLESDELFANLEQETTLDSNVDLEDLSSGLTDLSFDLDDTQTEETSSLDFTDEVESSSEQEHEFNLSTQESNSYEDIEILDSLEDSDEGFLNLDEADEITTKFELAEAYIEMGDSDGAREILEEIIKEGDPSQQDRAQILIDGLQ